MKIKELDQITIEKIAAGEVILRPESIVKEAVENSIDAGANTIIVDIMAGGKSYIRITDNGSGIAKEDLKNAFKKHYTSKIIDFNDIYRLTTRGFRGEALNSIQNVSSVNLISKTKDSDIANSINYDYGEFKSMEIAAGNVGTTLIAKDLFKNMPVRLNMLASDKTEENRIRYLMERFSICNPDISFKLIANSRVLLNTSGSSDLKETIFELYGLDIVNDLIEINNDDKYKLSGFVGNNRIYRNNKVHQMFFINGRLVDNPELYKIVENAYNNKLPAGKRPIFFLFLDIAADEIDVNIHPTKKYISFIYEEEVLDFIYNNIVNALAINKSIITKNITENKAYDIADIEFNVEDDKLYNFDTIKDSNDKCFNRVKENISTDYRASDIYVKNEPAPTKSSLNSMQTELNIDLPDITLEFDENKPDFNFDYNLYELFPQNSLWTYNKPIGVIFNRYYLIENRPHDLLSVVDLKEASNRILYSSYTEDIRKNKLAVQTLIEPIKYKLNYDEYEKFLNAKDLFSQLGFDITTLGEDIIVLRAIPMSLTEVFKEEYLMDLLDNIKLNNKESLLLPNLIKSIVQISSHANKFYNDINAKNIFAALMSTDNPYTSPTGRVIFSVITKEEFTRWIS